MLQGIGNGVFSFGSILLVLATGGLIIDPLNHYFYYSLIISSSALMMIGAFIGGILPTLLKRELPGSPSGAEPLDKTGKKECENE